MFIEEAFERLLLDYDRVFSAMAIPACLWRRTGEIYKANREFAELVGVDNYMLRDVCVTFISLLQVRTHSSSQGRLCIYELMAEDSAVNYWEVRPLLSSTEHITNQRLEIRPRRIRPCPESSPHIMCAPV